MRIESSIDNLKSSISMTVNGARRSVETPPEESLLSVLRNRLQLTGTKYGCGEGQCGACTVLIDGRPARSCRTQVSEAAGKKVTTIEGLARAGRLHPVQAAFLEVEAFQCGFCTPGMIVSAVGLLEKNPDPAEEDIAGHLTGNICRCGTYPRILAAVRQAATTMRKKS
jgi:aerobic-type carbon monoxide dehydrogenase small subunit (CoxS/CutS family)